MEIGVNVCEEFLHIACRAVIEPIKRADILGAVVDEQELHTVRIGFYKFLCRIVNVGIKGLDSCQRRIVVLSTVILCGCLYKRFAEDRADRYAMVCIREERAYKLVKRRREKHTHTVVTFDSRAESKFEHASFGVFADVRCFRVGITFYAAVEVKRLAV